MEWKGERRGKGDKIQERGPKGEVGSEKREKAGEEGKEGVKSCEKYNIYLT